MLDIRWIRENPSKFDEALKKRGLAAAAEELIGLDQIRRDHQTKAQTIQTRRNEASKEIGKLKGAGKNADTLIREVSELRETLQSLESQEKKASEDLTRRLASIPNIPADDVPSGKEEEDNLEIRQFGTPRSFSFEPLDHVSIGEKFDEMDFEAASKLSGSRFVVLKGNLARLERALATFMLDLHTEEFGYTEVSPPVLVRDDAVYGTGQLPKFSEDLFRTENGFWLIPTAEVPLTNLVADTILEEKDLPIRLTAYTNCFRSEAGAAGRDTRGMLRQHQFNKVELVSIVHPTESEAEHQRMTEAAEEVLRKLELPYRVMLLCSGDMGFSARRTYDLEVWLPGQNRYREISSCSTCGDFQSRRMRSRFRAQSKRGINFPHTLNGSGIAVGRALIAVIENYQNKDGSVSVPEVLREYMGGINKLEPNGS
ncbi:MAG: serine--tRNA ligase [Pseudomonadota bacterium]|nr:serine--tRNA ligase [Pseudomonadota bacterium]